MPSLQRAGGVAALVLVLAYVVGIALNLSVLDLSVYDDPVERLQFLADNQLLATAQIVFIYVIFSVFLVVFSLALYDRLHRDAPALAQVATAFGLLWATLALGLRQGHRAVSTGRCGTFYLATG